MESILCIPLGIIVERRRADSRVWRASGVLVGPTRLRAGSPLWRDGEAGYYFAGRRTLSLCPRGVAAYRRNLEQPVPRLYVVLTAQEHNDAPPSVHLLTAAPAEAESYAVASDLILVDGLPMPKQLRDMVAAYIDEYVPPGRRSPGVPQQHTRADRSPRAN